MKLIYQRKEKDLPLVCYVDSDWASDLTDRKSVTDFVIKIYGNCVAWVTRKQNCVALSSSEAELGALCAGVQDCLWYKKMLYDMNVNILNFKVFEDKF
ncbi:hypothetical protein QE152_g9165 [Popillia japonica]|uniref:Polyprotein n=1 Tax=Popillia japonica TaxID=7064 RepID=A0AAW1LVM0_POPJA